MPDLVKGASRPGGKNLTDDAQIFTKAQMAEKALRSATSNAIKNPAAAWKGLTPEFQSQFGLFGGAHPSLSGGIDNLVNELNQVLSAELGKNITLTSPLASGIVPYDLLAPSRLIYPVYSPLRNRLPRVQGQGTSRRAKVFTGISGSQTPSGSGTPIDWSQSELVGGSLPTWPLNLPAAGSQTAVDINIPYQFFGLSEALSWLAQFAGQGFEDISALANLILMQEAMLAEEYQLVWATGTALVKPAAPTIALRTAGSNETAVAAAGSSKSYYIITTARDIFGQTAFDATKVGEAAVGTTATDVIDVTIAPVKGATTYSVYITAAATSGSAPGAAASYFLYSTTGAGRITIQGPLPGSGTNPPASDSGTSASTRYEGLISILSGHASDDASVYPSGFKAGYINQSVKDTLNTQVLNNALKNLWDGTGAFRADPSEVIGEGSDLVNLANDVLLNNSSSNFRIQIQSGDGQAGVRGGAAVSEFQNPVTRSLVALTVHPWLTQGTALLMSYTLPQPWTNVSNVFEVTNVQDYLSVSWPVIDASFRYSIFLYGALVAYAPQYCGLLQGLQNVATTPYS